jgi:hypothetical protein
VSCPSGLSSPRSFRALSLVSFSANSSRRSYRYAGSRANRSRAWISTIDSRCYGKRERNSRRTLRPACDFVFDGPASYERRPWCSSSTSARSVKR